ncbi:carbohydrate sulfotransferase 12-like [Salarias fasciatus]|uniref:carbohydrate sulfotransferase 12-like n=1 Tax=Salarias fasciatus TaxID=181472 RepID=UPI00117703C8|nr:carbohydrate sulfotransferase 12-like [Salarias fasciatus]
MGKLSIIRLVFVLSLLMSLLIVVYWENLNWFYSGVMPVHYGPPHSGWSTRTNKDPSQPVRTSRSETSIPTSKPDTTLIPVQQYKEGEQREEEELKEEQKESSAVSAEDMEQRARKQRIMDVCSEMSSSKEFPKLTRPFDQITNYELSNLIVDDVHQIIYCYIPKVACSNWKKVMMVLTGFSMSGKKPYTDPLKIPSPVAHYPYYHLTFNRFPKLYGSQARQMMQDKLKNYTKFMFVRDPLVRLISAFRSKFVRPDPDFYKNYGKTLMRTYGNVSDLPDTVQEAHAAGLKPTFQQFIAYLVDPKTRRNLLNEHWRQMYRLCHPCQVKYDFIGRLESLGTDAEQVLKLMKVDHLVQLPSAYTNFTEASWVRDWYEPIPTEVRRELYKLYEPDFKLFGYPKPDIVGDEETTP